MAQFLDDPRLDRFIDLFDKQGLTEEALLFLTDRDLIEFGVSLNEDRALIMTAIRSVAPSRQLDIAASCSAQGRALSEKDPDGARQWYDKALAIREWLVAGEPENLKYLENLEISFKDIADWSAEKEPSKPYKYSEVALEEEKWIRKRCELIEKMVSLAPDNYNIQSRLASCYDQLCSVHLDLSQSKPAYKWAQKALAARKLLVERSSASSNELMALAGTYRSLARSAKRLNGQESAREFYEKEVETLELHLKSVDKDSVAVYTLMDAYKHLAVVERRVDANASMAHYEQAAKLLEQMLEDKGFKDVFLDTEDILNELTKIFLLLGDCSLDNNPKAALGWYKKECAVRRRLLESSPSDIDANTDLARCIKRVADLSETRDPEAGVLPDRNAEELPETHGSFESIDSNKKTISGDSRISWALWNALGGGLLLPVLLGTQSGVALFALYSGGVLLLKINPSVLQRVRFFGFGLPENAITISQYVVPLFAVTLIAPFVGLGSGLLWGMSFLGFFVIAFFSIPSAYLLRQLHRRFESGLVPQTRVPFIVIGFAKDGASQVPPLFITLLQYVFFREGRRYVGSTEGERAKQERSEVFDPIGSVAEGQEELVSEWLLAMEDVDRSKGFRHIVSEVMTKALPIQLAMIFEFHARRMGVMFLTRSQAEGRSPGFGDYVARYAAGVITLPASGITIRQAMKSLKWFLKGDDDKAEEVFAGDEFVRHSMSETKLGVNAAALWKSLGTTEFPWAHRVPGPWFILLNNTVAVPDDLHGYSAVSVVPKRWTKSARRIADLAAQGLIPGGNSAIAVGAEGRLAASMLIRGGLAPVADAYLRFRLSGSSVERFLNLFDCFEALIKYSYFFELIKSRELPLKLETLRDKLKRPSMGSWVGLLQDALKANSKQAREDVGADPIFDFWNGHLGNAHRVFVDAAKGSGLGRGGKVLGLHLDWIDWLVTVRNATKGHGGVTESGALPLWHDFHSVFLEAVVGLKVLVLDSRLLKKDGDNPIGPMVGSARGAFREPFRGDFSRLHAGDGCWAAIEIPESEGLVSLEPFVRFNGERCLTWNKLASTRTSTRGEYVDYSTGQMERVVL